MSKEGDVLSASRAKCWTARDAFFKCADDNDGGLDVPVPKPCKKLRKAYESSCRESWVKHFDKKRLHEKFVEKKIREEDERSRRQG